MKPLPTPKRSPWLRPYRTLKLILQPLQYFDDYTARYGDIYQLSRPGKPGFIMTSNPQAIKEIFALPGDRLTVGRGNSGLRFLLGEHSLLFRDGEAHQRQRRLLMPPFHGDCLRRSAQDIQAIAQEVTAHWQPGQEFLVRPVMQEITLRVILRVVFGLDCGDRYEQLRVHLSAILDAISSPLTSSLFFLEFLRQDFGPLSPWGRFLHHRERVRELLYEEIRSRRAAGDFVGGSDVLSLLLAATDSEGQPLSDAELHDELMTLLVAGHETTASSLAWALYWLHALPEVAQKLRQELATVSDWSGTQLAQLPYLSAIACETLRIYPIVPGTFVRVIQEPISLLGYELEAGTALVALIYSTHHRQDLYPQPGQFRPERFLERQYAPHEFLPFGGGSRRCIGSALAMLELKLVLAEVMSRFELTLTSQKPLKPVRRGLTLAPPGHFKLRVAARRQRLSALPSLAR